MTDVDVVLLGVHRDVRYRWFVASLGCRLGAENRYRYGLLDTARLLRVLPQICQHVAQNLTQKLFGVRKWEHVDTCCDRTDHICTVVRLPMHIE